MISTLEDFVRNEYPNHGIGGDIGGVGSPGRLTAFTAVAEYRTSDLAARSAAHLREIFGADRVAVITATPPAPTVVRQGAEDTNSMADVPKRRPLVGALGLGTVVLAIVAIVAAVAGAHPAVVVVSAVFAATLAAIEGAIIFGGARFAGEKAWDQQNVPAEQIEFAAVFATSEHDALEAGKLLTASGATSIRIVNESGAWHLPNLYTTSE